MEKINWQRVLIISGIIVVIMIFVFLGMKVRHGREILKMSKESEGPAYPPEFRSEDLKRIPVPEPGQKFQEGIAIPKESVSSAPGAKSKLRVFEAKGENGIIFPIDFLAYQNDIIDIELAALDKNYDFFLEGYNLRTKVKRGGTRTIEFQALNLGVYNFYCSLCSTKEKPAGKIIIVPR
jgi:hypothetical protein